MTQHSPLESRPTIYDAPPGAAAWNFKLIALAMVIGSCFWMIDHKIFASSYYLFVDDAFEAEDITVDSIETVGRLSAPSRAFLGLAGAVMVCRPPRGKLFWANSVYLAVATMFAGCLASVFWSVNPGVSIHKCAALLLLLMAALGLSRQLTLHELVRVIPAVCVGFIAIGLLAEIALGNFSPHLSGYRFVGTCHPNTLAVYASICCLSATALSSGPSANRGLAVFFIIVGISTLLLTKSRTTMLALFIALSSLGYLRLQKNQRMFVVSIVLLLVSLAGFLISLQKQSTLESLGESLAFGRTEDVGSLTGRLPLWEELSNFINDRPVLGHGYLAFWDKRRVEYLRDVLGWEVPHGHNMYVDVLLDGGAAGLAIFALVLLSGMGASVDRFRIYSDPAIAFTFALVIYAIVHGTGESLFKLPTFLAFTLLVFMLRTGSLTRSPVAVS